MDCVESLMSNCILQALRSHHSIAYFQRNILSNPKSKIPGRKTTLHPPRTYRSWNWPSPLLFSLSTIMPEKASSPSASKPSRDCWSLQSPLPNRILIGQIKPLTKGRRPHPPIKAPNRTPATLLRSSHRSRDQQGCQSGNSAIFRLICVMCDVWKVIRQVYIH